DDISAHGSGREDTRIAFLCGPACPNLVLEFLVAALECIDLILQVDDLLDPDEVDSLVLRQLLDQSQLGDVLSGVASSPARSAFRSDETQSVILPQRLRVHAR